MLYVIKYKYDIIILGGFMENINSSLNLLISNIPDNLSTIEKVRWLYIKLGKLFSYNYNIISDKTIMDQKLDFENDFISRYQTCVQISEILNIIFNNIDEDLSCEVIERTLDERTSSADNHVANAITIKSTNEKYILDLTADLYLIQSGCQTKHFGYESDIYSTYDIMSPFELKEIDEKLGLILDDDYTDKKIEEAQEKIAAQDFSDKSYDEVIDIVISEITKLIKPFKGFLEAKQFVSRLLKSLLPSGYNFSEYNFSYRGEDENKYVSCFAISNNKVDENSWYFFEKDMSLIKTDPFKIDEMLKEGWETRSTSIYDVITDEINRRRK